MVGIEEMVMQSATKQFVKKRMAGLESGEISRRGPGRPRIHPVGWVRDRKDPNVPPAISAARQEAGRAGAASRKDTRIQNQLRTKRGQEFEERWTQDKVVFDKEVHDAFTEEFVGWSASILQGIAWDLNPVRPDDFDYDEHVAGVPLEDRKYFSIYPDTALRDLVDYAKHGFRLTEPLRQLLIRVLTEYLNWESELPEDSKRSLDPSDPPKFQTMLEKLNRGEDVFVGEPEQKEKNSLLTEQEQIQAYYAERAKWSGGFASPSSFPTREDLAKAAQRQAEIEEQNRLIRETRQKQEEAQRLREEQLRQTVGGDALQYLRDGR